MPQISEEVALALKVMLNLVPQVERGSVSDFTVLRADPMLRCFDFVDKEFGSTVLRISICEIKSLPKPLGKELAKPEKDIEKICLGLSLWANQRALEWGRSFATKSVLNAS